MNILITGAKGWIGGRVSDTIQSLHPNIKVRGFDSGVVPYGDWRELWDHFMWNYSNCENTDGRDDNWLVPFDLIIHIGGLSNSLADHEACFDSNYVPTTDIVKLAMKHEAKLLYFSSAAAIKPTSAYGYSKFAAECHIYATMKPEDYCIFQPYNVWGPGEECKESPSIVHQIKHNSLGSIFEDCVRDFVHISDVVQAVLNVVRRWTDGTHQLGTGIGTPIRDLPRMLDVEWDRYLPTSKVEGYVAKRVADPQKCLSEWQPGHIELDLREGHKWL